MKIEEITEAEYKALFNRNEECYFANGCIFDEETDNLIAFGWYEDALHEASKFYKVVK